MRDAQLTLARKSPKKVCRNSALMILAILLSASAAGAEAMNQAPASSIAGTYGDWTMGCGSDCKDGAIFNGLIVWSEGNCVKLFFEARGDERDYQMFAAGTAIGDEVIAFEGAFLREGSKIKKKSCKIVFRFDGHGVVFEKSKSDAIDGCTGSQSVANTWLNDFERHKSSSSSSIPNYARKEYRQSRYRKYQLAEVSNFCG